MLQYLNEWIVFFRVFKVTFKVIISRTWRSSQCLLLDLWDNREWPWTDLQLTQTQAVLESLSSFPLSDTCSFQLTTVLSCHQLLWGCILSNFGNYQGCRAMRVCNPVIVKAAPFPISAPKSSKAPGFWGTYGAFLAHVSAIIRQISGKIHSLHSPGRISSSIHVSISS